MRGTCFIVQTTLLTKDKYTKMKKTIAFIIALFFVPSLSLAMVDSEFWSYQFHLEYSKGVLQVEKGVDYPYSPIPVEYHQQYDPAQADFYGVIFNIKNKEDARFGFMTPTTTTVTLGKSLLSVWAPKYADADHVSFYTKTNKHLFDVSVRDSSFCNDNNICDENIGENGNNCPNDCPVVINPTIQPAVATTPEPATIPVVAPIMDPNTTTQAGPTSGAVVTTTTPSAKTFFTPGVLIMLIGGLLLVVLGIILLRIRKNMD